ncbi:MAG: DNA-protecting protein DprA [Alphaproteobacteria bacterium]|nr:MAG: DNA-protecting protein DprA [Alphaproteobacteria bacterium]
MDFRPEAGLPSTWAERRDWLRLARSRNVGPGSFRRLVARFGSAAAALEALPELAARGGRRDYLPADRGEAEREMERAEAAGARMLLLGGLGYPEALARIGDPPPVLWAIGDIALAGRSCIALVGARNASSLGQRMATALGGDLGAAGHVIVSGLARGIDAFAHRAALDTGTVAVLAGGVDIVYPEENAGLAEEIAARGLMISEAPMGTAPTARHFPRRNRLISGLSRAVVLVEAAERSGSLITARCALEQGREVLAVPGSPLDPRAGGCNLLLRQGAGLVRSAADVEEALELPGTGMLREPINLWVPEPAAPPAPDLPERLAELLASAPVAEDDLVRAADAAPAQVLQALVELDLAGRVERRAGGVVALIG